MDTEGRFYIGREYDLDAGERTEKPLLYDPDDLTTHAVVVGMTGSGKTGLCIDLLEEAALQGIPALLVDPKGDLTNLLLRFPGLTAAEFEPWVDPDQARREDRSLQEQALATATLWRDGLSDWGIEPSRIQLLKDSVRATVFTPGAEAGLPINILTALAAPGEEVRSQPDALRDRVETTATALLGLVEMDADPLTSKEHILLSNLIDHGWSQGYDLDLTELIRQIQSPPFEKLGALDLDQVIPSDERAEMAARLNNLLASPSFAPWTVGAALDVEALLWAEDGTPRQSVFYLAHLSDSQRMFFVTLLLGAMESWMRRQSGSTGLRALFYMDEVFGYLPPTAKPPSKPPMLRLLKQARAFGLGLVLATQNPVDLDYKALSNAGTWFIGRLQTEQDKARLLDGLESAASQSGFDRAWSDKTISGLAKRVFLLHNVHAKKPHIFQTRWAMAYLRGPLTLTHIPKLNELAGAGDVVMAADQGVGTTAWSQTRPALTENAQEAYLLATDEAEVQEVVYKPALAAVATVRFVDRKAEIETERQIAYSALDPDPKGKVDWEAGLIEPLPDEAWRQEPAAGAQYVNAGAPFSDDKAMKAIESDFGDYVYRSAELRLSSNPELKLVAEPGETEEEFAARCAEAAEAARQQEAAEVKPRFEAKLDKLKDRLSKEQRELAEDEAEFSSRRMEEWVTHAENLLGFLGGSRSRRRVSSSLSKRRMTTRARADAEESEAEIEAFKQDLAGLEEEMQDELAQLAEKWARAAEERAEVVVTPRRKDVHVDFFGVVWLPYSPSQGGRLRPAYDTTLLDPPA